MKINKHVQNEVQRWQKHSECKWNFFLQYKYIKSLINRGFFVNFLRLGLCLCRCDRTPNVSDCLLFFNLLHRIASIFSRKWFSEDVFPSAVSQGTSCFEPFTHIRKNPNFVLSMQRLSCCCFFFKGNLMTTTSLPSLIYAYVLYFVQRGYVAINMWI